LKRIREVEKEITKGYSEFISSSKFVSLNDTEKVRTSVSAKIVKKFMHTHPSKAETELFFRLNKLKNSPGGAIEF